MKRIVTARLQRQRTHDQFTFLLGAWAMDAYIDRARISELLHAVAVKDNA